MNKHIKPKPKTLEIFFWKSLKSKLYKTGISNKTDKTILKKNKMNPIRSLIILNELSV